MEKTNMNKTSEAFDETSRMTSQWLADTCSVMTNFYEKQLRNTWDSFSHFFDASTERNGNNRAGYTPSFIFGNNFYRSMINPLGLFQTEYNFANLWSNHLADMNKQISGFRGRMFNLWVEEFKNNYANWDEFNKVMEEEWKATQDRLNSLQDAYMKRLNSSIEFNKKIGQEMNTGFETAIARNKKMWEDLVKKPETHEKPEKETDRKDWHAKKHSKELVHH